MQGLLRTEMTDAVNSGLVEGADKSASTLKGAAAVKKSGKGRRFTRRPSRCVT